jgi:hypothetical protein
VLERPLLRGVFHQMGFMVSLVVGTLLIVGADGRRGHVAAAVFAVAVRDLPDAPDIGWRSTQNGRRCSLMKVASTRDRVLFEVAVVLKVGGKRVRVHLCPQLVQELRRPLDIGEKKRDGACREIGSRGAIIRPPRLLVQSTRDRDARPSRVPVVPGQRQGSFRNAGQGERSSVSAWRVTTPGSR